MFPLPNGYAGLTPFPAQKDFPVNRFNDLQRDFNFHTQHFNSSDLMRDVGYHGGWGHIGPSIASTWQGRFMGMQSPYSRAGVRGMYPGGYF